MSDRRQEKRTKLKLMLLEVFNYERELSTQFIDPLWIFHNHSSLGRHLLLLTVDLTLFHVHPFLLFLSLIHRPALYVSPTLYTAIVKRTMMSRSGFNRASHLVSNSVKLLWQMRVLMVFSVEIFMIKLINTYGFRATLFAFSNKAEIWLRYFNFTKNKDLDARSIIFHI